MDIYLAIRVALQLLALAIGCVGLYCFFRVFLAMRENGERPLATLCLVTLLLLGVGAAVAFVYGVMKAREWELTPTMMLWGSCTAAILALLSAASAVVAS